MVSYKTVIQQFDQKGEKTCWTYIEIPADIAKQIKHGYKKSFRVKGKLDEVTIQGVALLPMGGGSFIMPLNAALRKKIGKRTGAMIALRIEEDKEQYQVNAQLLECLADVPEALDFFNTTSKSYQHYFSKWIESAKTDLTRAKRITMTVNAMVLRQNFGEMLRANKRTL